MGFPLITAHAGCAGTKSNTVYSLEVGIKACADILEIDVRNTKDKVVVLYHDDYLNNNKDAIISQMDYEEVLRLEPSISRLEEALNIAKRYNKIVNLDVKTPECISEMMNIVRACDMSQNVIITGLNKDLIMSMGEHIKSVPVIMSAEEHVDFDKVTYMDFVKKTCRDAVITGSSGINICYMDCRKELVEYSRLRCLPIFVWTVDSQEDMKKCIDMGVTSITTHNIDMLKNLNIGGEK